MLFTTIHGERDIFKKYLGVLKSLNEFTDKLLLYQRGFPAILVYG